MNDFTDIRYEVEDPYAIITLNRPEQLNAFTYHTLDELRAAFVAAEADTSVVGIIITGEGRAFSAGLDMATLTETTQSSNAPRVASDDELPGLFSYLLEIPKPIIAAINGVTAGGGLILALMSDLRFASVDAALTTVFLKRGLIAEHGSSWLLPRLVGVSKALDLLWMSDKITAQEAREVGLVDRVVASELLLDTARDYVSRLSKTIAPKAIGATKRLVYQHLGLGYEAALRDAERVQNQFVTAPDAIEGAQSFLERRPPEFERVGK
ncbi:MAG: enoyl-CoA hydratase-related protein [Pseudomonadales bacterium]|jgi:enoyl-CoA hydratase/carnithine racemase|nr:enoyl-CoA hydratase-related protein [Pseudomonadales bacterium]